MIPWEDQLRRELDEAVRDVHSSPTLPAAVVAGGRRRLRRRRAVIALPAAVLVLGGGAAVGSRLSEAPVRIEAATVSEPAAAATSTPSPVPAQTTRSSEESERALDAYFGAGYDYDDAVELGQSWHVDPFEAKMQAGERLLDGQPLEISP
ncbi:MAG: hypothetical protein ACRYF3_02730 [Janthinobacterium lividum]